MYNCRIPGFLVVLDVVAKVTPKAIWRPQMVKNVKIDFAAFSAYRRHEKGTNERFRNESSYSTEQESFERRKIATR